MDGDRAPQTHRNSPTPTFIAFSSFKKTRPPAAMKNKNLEEPRGVVAEPQPHTMPQRPLFHKEPVPSPLAAAMEENNGLSPSGEAGKPSNARADPLGVGLRTSKVILPLPSTPNALPITCSLAKTPVRLRSLPVVIPTRANLLVIPQKFTSTRQKIRSR